MQIFERNRKTSLSRNFDNVGNLNIEIFFEHTPHTLTAFLAASSKSSAAKMSRPLPAINALASDLLVPEKGIHIVSRERTNLEVERRLEWTISTQKQL